MPSHETSNDMSPPSLSANNGVNQTSSELIVHRPSSDQPVKRHDTGLLFDAEPTVIERPLFPEGAVALSIKQPWATLIVLGIKTIEIRTWSAKRRGPVFIHAGAQHDPREHGWSFVPKEFLHLTKLRQGLLGTAEMIDCRRYQAADQFVADRDLHRNHPDWYQAPKMFGFVFENPKIIDFYPLKGNLFFFDINAINGGETGRPKV